MRSIRLGRAALGAALAIAMVSCPMAISDETKPAGASTISQYLPDGTVVVVSLNLKQLMDAPLIKADEKAFKQNMAEMSKALEGFGIDPMKDLSRIVLAAGLEAPRSILLLLEGKFDSSKVAGKLKEIAADKKNNLTVVTGEKSTHYKMQMVYPVPATAKDAGQCCQPYGRTTMIWGAGKSYPVSGEDFAYQIFRKRNCCAGAY